MFEDAENWEVPHLEIPYYFDHRGEISRGKGNNALVEKDHEREKEKALDREMEQQKHRLLEARFVSLEAQLASLSRKQQAKVPVQQQQPQQPQHMNMYGPPQQHPYYPPPQQYPGYGPPFGYPNTVTPPIVPTTNTSSSGGSNLEKMMELLLQKLDTSKKTD